MGEYKSGYTIEEKDGSRVWYLKGQYHREDGPAVERANGDKVWYINSLLHRTDGPAIEFASGTRMWYINNNPHREDGPAFEDADGLKSWWIKGVRLTEEEFIKKIKNKKFTVSEIETLKSYGIEVDI